MAELSVPMFLPTLETVGLHDHALFLHEHAGERAAAFAHFLRIGLERGERCWYVADDPTAPAFVEALGALGVDVDAARQGGRLELLNAADVYLRGGRFDPAAVIAAATAAVAKATADGCTGLRIASDSAWPLSGAPGLERLLEYERAAHELIERLPLIAACWYDPRRTPAALTAELLRLHPLVGTPTLVARSLSFVPAAAVTRP